MYHRSWKDERWDQPAFAVCHGVKLLRRLTSRRVVLLDRCCCWPIGKDRGVKPSGIIYRVPTLQTVKQPRRHILTALPLAIPQPSHEQPSPSLQRLWRRFTFSLFPPFLPSLHFLSRPLSFTFMIQEILLSNIFILTLIFPYPLQISIFLLLFFQSLLFVSLIFN